MTKCEEVEMYFDAIAAAIANRCYCPCSSPAQLWLGQHIREDLDEIRSLLQKPKADLLVKKSSKLRQNPDSAVKIEVPGCHLGDVPVESLPAYLVPARAAADALSGLALWPGDGGRVIALEIIKAAIRDLNTTTILLESLN